jgi:type VI secretion system protein ImpG
MNPRLIKYYTRELEHLREMGAEFAKEFPKIAGRLGLDGFECLDPYVERLLEGFAFLAARVQLKLDAEFPRFTQHLLEMVYPEYLSPTPSMAVVQMHPDLTEGGLADGFVVPRHTVLRSRLGGAMQTPCEYRTGQAVTLWPLELAEVAYSPHAGDMTGIDTPHRGSVKSGIRFRLKTTAGLKFDALALDRLTLLLRGTAEIPMRIYELIVGHSTGIVASPAAKAPPWREYTGPRAVRQAGFENDQALLPYDQRSFHGYRLLHEYFTLPERFMFVELTGLGPAVRRCNESQLDVVVLLDRSEPSLQNEIDASRFALFCAPAVNLFPKRGDRIHLKQGQHEYHVVPDRTRPLDFEVYRVRGVEGHGSGTEPAQAFLPFYAYDNRAHEDHLRAYYETRRTPRVLSSKERAGGTRSRYVGSEVFLSLVDADRAPYSSDLRQLALSLLCTNRDLPMQMPVGKERTDFTLESGAPVESVRCVAGPTAPRPSWVEGDTTWRLISQLSLNYLSLVDGQEGENAAALRELLLLYTDETDKATHKQIEGVRSVSSKPVVRRLPVEGPMAFGRGLELSVTFDEAAFEGTGIFLLGSVLDRFFAKYVALNSFTETVVRSANRGEVMRWPVRIGRRQTL